MSRCDGNGRVYLRTSSSSGYHEAASSLFQLSTHSHDRVGAIGAHEFVASRRQAAFARVCSTSKLVKDMMKTMLLRASNRPPLKRCGLLNGPAKCRGEIHGRMR